MQDNVKKMYEGYWQSKSGLEKFGDYERNHILKSLFNHSTEKILDLACGEGAVAEFLMSLGCEVVGMDISKEALKKAETRGVKTVLGNVEERFPFKDAEFDAVFWGDNVEHLFLPMNTLKEINRVLKKGGRLVLSTPNTGYWRYRIYYLLNGCMEQTEWYGKYPWEWEHIRFFNKQIMDNFLKEGGFRMNNFFGVSRRRIDKLFKSFNSSLFGMIMVVEAVKK